MMFKCFAIVAFACAVNAQYFYNAGQCPPENSAVAAFRNLTDVREPLFIPLIARVLKDSSYALPEIQDLLRDVDLPWKVSLPLNDTNSFLLFHPFLHRCCDIHGYLCSSADIVLQYIKFQGGVCWVVWPEAYYIYKRCTCCSCLLSQDCPVVGRCVETDYFTVDVVAYCPAIMYSDRFQKIAVQIPSKCKCQANCPVPLDYPIEGNSPELQKRLHLSRQAVTSG